MSTKPVDLIKTMNKGLKQIYNSALTSLRRRGLERAGSDIDDRKNINFECGYPDDITLEDLNAMYRREPVARRLVKLYPNACWKNQPEVKEDDDPDTLTEFEQAFVDLGNDLGEKSYMQDEKNSKIWSYLKRADVLAGKGSFGIIVLGIDDGLPLHEPVAYLNDETGQFQDASSVDRKLVSLHVFGEEHVEITGVEQRQEENGPKHPRFGYPTEYTVEISSNDLALGITQVADSEGSVKIHWSRVIHIADNLESSEVYGESRMVPNWNRLYDIRKVTSGSGEMYWLGAFPGISFETYPELADNFEIDDTAAKEEIEKYFLSLQRYFSIPGIHANMLAPTVSDPTPQVKLYIEQICIAEECPIRVFVGSERGELASSQDAISWEHRVQERRTNYITPAIIAPFVNRLINLRVLPAPKDKYRIVWPDIENLSTKDRAEVGKILTEAISMFIQGGGESVMEIMDWLTKIIGMDRLEAKVIVDNAMDRFNKEAEEGMTDLEFKKQLRAPIAPELPPGADDNQDDSDPKNGKGANDDN